MPVGGDVTQFSIGLMAVLGRAIRSGRLPLWNDLWGYGFPGVGESQMGVFYPPHLLLHGLLPTELAYATSLVLHTIWGGLGGWWAARRFGVSPAGSALAGFAWSASGFFVIHLPHQWGYTTGSWMPWAWGLAWVVVAGRGTAPDAVFAGRGADAPGVAGPFPTGVHHPGGGGAAGALVAGRNARRDGRPRCAAWPRRPPPRRPSSPWRRCSSGRRSGWPAWPRCAGPRVSLRVRRDALAPRQLRGPHAVPGVAAVASPGLGPVPYLARGAPGLRGAGAAVPGTPYHPPRVSPRPGYSAADGPRRGDAGPEPRAVRAGFRILEPAARVLVLPGPGAVVAGNRAALGLLAGKGFDAWRTWPRPGRSLARFVLLAWLGPMVAVAAVELALTSTERSGWPAVARGLDAALRTLPWSRDSDFRDLAALAAIARRRQDDLRVESALARQGRFEGSRVFAGAADDLSPRAGRDGRDPPGLARARAFHKPPRVLRDGTGRADGHRPLAPGTSSRVRPGPDPIPRGAEPGAGPAGARSARDARRGRLAQPADGRRRGAGLGLPDARPARAGVADKPGPRAARGQLPARR